MSKIQQKYIYIIGFDNKIRQLKIGKRVVKVSILIYDF